MSGRPLLPALPFRELVLRAQANAADQLATFFHRHLCELVGDIPPLEEPA